MARRQFSDYVDGRLQGSARQRVAAHLKACDACDRQVDSLNSVRSTLMELPEVVTPSALRSELQVISSRHIELLRSSFLERLWTRWKFRVDDLMRPLTIPATGGLLSSIVLFGALALTIGTTTRVVAYDVPVLYADRLDANLVPVELRSSVILTLSVDGTGRITEYAVQDGADSFVGAPSRLQDNNIALPEFRTVLAITHPVSRDISILFTPLVYRP